MTIEIRYSVNNPEAGVTKSAGGPLPGMGGPTRGRGEPNAVPESPILPSAGMAKRLDSLENKTIYLVDTGFGGSYQFMLQLQKWFAEHMPSVTTIRKRKPGNVFRDDNNELWEEVKAKGQAVVLGVAG